MGGFQQVLSGHLAGTLRNFRRKRMEPFNPRADTRRFVGRKRASLNEFLTGPAGLHKVAAATAHNMRNDQAGFPCQVLNRQQPLHRVWLPTCQLDYKILRKANRPVRDVPVASAKRQEIGGHVPMLDRRNLFHWSRFYPLRYHALLNLAPQRARGKRDRGAGRRGAEGAKLIRVGDDAFTAVESPRSGVCKEDSLAWELGAGRPAVGCRCCECGKEMTEEPHMNLGNKYDHNREGRLRVVTDFSFE